MHAGWVGNTIKGKPRVVSLVGKMKKCQGAYMVPQSMWNWAVLSGVWGVSRWGLARGGGEANALDKIPIQGWQADTAEFMPDPRASGSAQWSVSGEERRETLQSWGQTHCWKPPWVNSLSLSPTVEVKWKLKTATNWLLVVYFIVDLWLLKYFLLVAFTGNDSAPITCSRCYQIKLLALALGGAQIYLWNEMTCNGTGQVLFLSCLKFVFHDLNLCFNAISTI